jgi:hypothetical protein
MEIVKDPRNGHTGSASGHRGTKRLAVRPTEMFRYSTQRGFAPSARLRCPFILAGDERFVCASFRACLKSLFSNNLRKCVVFLSSGISSEESAEICCGNPRRAGMAHRDIAISQKNICGLGTTRPDSPARRPRAEG